MFVSYTIEQHDDHYYNDDAKKDCVDCAEDARIDKIERREEAVYGAGPAGEWDI